MKLFKNFKTKKQLRKEIQLLQTINKLLSAENGKLLKDVKQGEVLKVAYRSRFIGDSTDSFIESVCRGGLSKELQKHIQVTISTAPTGAKIGTTELYIVVDKEV